jgi:hypothetical protein
MTKRTLKERWNFGTQGRVGYGTETGRNGHATKTLASLYMTCIINLIKCNNLFFSWIWKKNGVFGSKPKKNLK